MNKPIFFTGLSFFLIEMIGFLVYLASQIEITEQALTIGIFGFFNFLFGILMVVGLFIEDK